MERACAGSIIPGFPKGFLLGPLFVFIYINDLVDNISSDADFCSHGHFFYLQLCMTSML